MSKLIVLNLGKGNLHQGFSTVIAQLWQTDVLNPMQFTGGLPAAPQLEYLYQRWQKLYTALYASLGWRNRNISEFEIEEEDVTNISQAEFESICQEFQKTLNTWLNSLAFLNIDRKLRTQLLPTDEIRCVITAECDQVLKLPWCLWHFFNDYPLAEIALSPPEYSRAIKNNSRKTNGKVRILAILGDSHHIDVEKDQNLLQQLPNAELKFLVEPNRCQLTEQLWASGWDILFFAGHSSSQGKGKMVLNPQETLTIDQLKYGLQKAIAQGLQLAIFNSCDGLGIAEDLADLHLPQVIVMREPVPDRVAQEFLKHFLTAFSSQGQTLYTAVREARERLQSLENDFPCATWLPVICQNPAEISPTWQDLCGQQLGLKFSRPNLRQLPIVFIGSSMVTLSIVLIRLIGGLQALELAAFDQLMRSRPQEQPDPRLLVVTVTDQDIQAQGQEPRQGSLSDKYLNLLLTKLEQYQPAVIGLDIYRDFPVSVNQPELAKRMQKSDRFFAICKRADPEYDPTGISPPPEIPEARLGFSDFVQDEDSILRRHLMAMTPNPISSTCTPAYAFSTRLAFLYLQSRGITAKFTPDWNLQLGNKTFGRLHKRSGGYHSIDAQGSQILLNYRFSPSVQAIAPQVTMSQVLNGQINPNALKNRIILIGVTSNSSSDYWSTPYSKSPLEVVPGIFIQAQMVSQMISAALDNRPLLWVWTQWSEIGWIWYWSFTGGLLAWYVRKITYLIIVLAIAIITLFGLCLIILIQGGWIPLVPPIISLLVSSIQITYIKTKIASDR
ncbi:CHASE2 domain-containing protein [Anabaena cylindrica FACHB-243]|uniref:Chase2 sensor protein n=1 Tax=Anabaena cylindrica (strain ATCC 27899 / PCC 7122) TaxID=272123 RepID=K9ZBP7_ANACC|nr:MULTISPECIES: CHASE2 domain-containing protein [Anabaena]AFZ55780.1 putative Chase2 sensor protein [Anabaena cylindrica PCC 7122]MBD2420219.1 CHASE2 domain-containing protein [Anabaena cylindrica FACHB-243]MBY5283090.1 CHASE2 domain-containing protein [Anabaena sp. CCAP 1446/1C]MBY5307807.1 CHASE2 domain-containing protein [Anabaena sp. CCAP 1446/1C]MCM2406129.1 CHASE2 domain-containing protein [Anabaena sp. CCAP 1446/1C]